MSASVLFDAPGPRARRRHAVLTALGVLVLLAVLYLVYRKMDEAGQLQAYMWEPFLTDASVWKDYLLVGLLNTLKGAVISVVLAGVFGIIFGMGRLSHVRWLRWACGIIVEFFRAVPVLIMMVFLYYGYFATSTWMPSEYGPLAAVVIALTVYNGSVIAELVRSGVYALPAGQGEAGLSIGLTPAQTLRMIQLPQALTAMLPALISQLVVVLKDTALGTIVTFPELLTWGKTLGSAYGNAVPAYIVVAAMFILLNYALTKAAQWVERRMLRHRTTAGPVTTTNTMVEGVAEPGGPAAAGTRIMAEGLEEARDRTGNPPRDPEL